jgi:microcystin-dependent protein
MAITYVDHPATAEQTDFTFTFDYLEDEHVKVEINGVDTTAFIVIVESNGDKKIRLTTPTVGGESVRVRRRSAPNQNLVDFVNGSVLTESELDLAYRHNRYLSEEIAELNDQSLQKEIGGTEWDALGLRIQNVGTPSDTTDAVTKVYLDNKVAQVSSGATQPPLKWVFSAISGTNNTYTVTGAEVLGDTAYEVSIDGLIKEPTVEYTVDPDTDTLTIIPNTTNGQDIVVIQRGFGVAVTGTVGTDSLVDGSVTNPKLAAGAVTSDKISTTDTNFNVQSDGKVGIGTTSPGAALEVQTSDGPAGSTTQHMKLTRGTTVGAYLSTIRANASNDVSGLVLGVNTTNALTVKDDGKVGIGTTTPAHALDVTGDLNITGDYKVNGTNLQTVPTGTVSAFAGSAAPTGYALCDGSEVNRTTQAALFAVIGTTYGVGDGSTTFNLPDLRGRVVAGLDSADNVLNDTTSIDGTALGEVGGDDVHTLTEAQMPSHSHTANYQTGTGGSAYPGFDGSGDQVTSGQTSSTGGGQAHNNVQPTIILNYIIKT